MEQVKSIVAKAVEEKEAKLRVEYDAILEERLNEQYQTFLKHNEQIIHEQLSQSTYDCMFCICLLTHPVPVPYTAYSLLPPY
eukprot:Pgem_evm1s15379